MSNQYEGRAQKRVRAERMRRPARMWDQLF